MIRDILLYVQEVSSIIFYIAGVYSRYGFKDKDFLDTP